MSDKEFKFVVCVEWDSLEGFGFYVFLDDDLDWLIKRIAKAQKTGFDTAIGSCPNLVIKEAEETIREGNRIDITENFKNSVEKAGSPTTTPLVVQSHAQANIESASQHFPTDGQLESAKERAERGQE